tara:strand:- start:284 stop:406 length:123 start_codon:yes stop_codon:yes gene_type:complete
MEIIVIILPNIAPGNAGCTISDTKLKIVSELIINNVTSGL